MPVEQIRIRTFSPGQFSDNHPSEINDGAFAEIINLDIRNGNGVKLPGTSNFIDDIPAGQTFKYAQKFTLSNKYRGDIWLMHTVDDGNSRDKLWVKPYIDSSGAFVDEWQDLTEIEESLSITSVTGATACIISGLSSAVDDYYNGWIFVNLTINVATEISDYTGSTKELIFKHDSMNGQAGSDVCYIMRNPVKLNMIADDTHIYAFQVADQISFLKSRDDSIQVYTGGDKTLREKTDFKVIPLRAQSNLFGDSGNDEVPRFYMVRKSILPYYFNTDSGSATPDLYVNSSAPSGGEVAIHDPAPNTGFTFMLTAIYDGYQEAPFYPIYGGDDILNSWNWVTYAASKVLDIQIRINTLWDPNNDNWLPFRPFVYDGLVGYGVDLMFPKNITGFNLYIAEAIVATLPAGNLRQSAWRLVKTLKTSDSIWSWESGGEIGMAQATVTVDENAWLGAPEVVLATRLGHDAAVVHANADGAVVSNQRTYVFGVANSFNTSGSANDEKNKTNIYITPKNSAGDNTPDVIPFIGSSIAVQDYDMSEIRGYIASETDVTVFTDTGILNINSSTFVVSKKNDTNYLLNKNALVQVNGLVYFAARNDIMVYYPRFNTVQSIAAGRIREAWRAIDKDSNTCTVGYDNKLNVVVFTCGSTNFVFNVPRNPADSLTADAEAFGAWHKYDVTKEFNRYVTNTDGQLLGITTDGAMHGLFDGTDSESLQASWKTPAIVGPLNLRDITLFHKGDDKITAKIYDLKESSTVSVKDFDFYPDSNESEENVNIGLELSVMQIEFVIENSSNVTNTVISYDIRYSLGRR